MMLPLRPILAICLALVLMVTGQSMAVARGASAATGQMVLCIGSGSITVYTDDEGQPTSAPYICPDCALHLLSAVLPPEATMERVAGICRIAIPLTSVVNAPSISAPYRSRAPPVTI